MRSGIDAWLGSDFPLADWAIGDIPGDAARLINERSTDITARRGSSTLPVQRIRIEAVAWPGQQSGPTAIVTDLPYLVIGFKNWPDEADTNLRRGDRFFVEELQSTFMITTLIPGLLNSFQALAQVQQNTK